MTNLATIVVGPLAGPECRRALARGWLILVRTLAAMAVLLVISIAIWWWWIMQRMDLTYRPFFELRYGLAICEGILVTIALIMGPALLAGSLSGDKERGVLALLLTTRIHPREIVTGRITGKLAQVGMILVAALPGLILISALAGFSLSSQAMLLGLVVAVAFGGVGMAAVAATMSRRGRDALLSVYLMDLIFLLTPLSSSLGLPQGVFNWLLALNPYSGIEPLVWDEDPWTAAASAMLWIVLGVAGTAVASLRLRKACLAPMDGERILRRGSRRLWVPPVDEKRPMVWKELFIDRVGSIGKFGRWVGALLVLFYGGGSLLAAGIYFWDAIINGGFEWAEWVAGHVGNVVGYSGMLLCFLIEWAVGLRAAVSISSERERGTWDALLTSPLDGRSIVIGKLWGSLYALRWLIFASYVTWTVAAILGAVPVSLAVQWGVDVLIVGAFMAAVGVRTSLACATATRAMAVTLGIWLGSFVVVWVAGFFLVAFLFLFGNALMLAMTQFGLTALPVAAWIPRGLSPGRSSSTSNISSPPSPSSPIRDFGSTGLPDG